MNEWQSSQLAGGSSRSRGLNYPSPFLDFEKYYIPQTVKELFDFLGFAYLSDSNVKPAIESMSAYPITNLIYELPKEKNKESANAYKERWRTLLEKRLDVRVFNITVGLDYFVYGNAFVSVYKPFRRHLSCKNCHHKGHVSEYEITRPDTQWKWQNMKFLVFCKRCKGMQEAAVKDVVKTNAIDEISLVRWSPYQISIKKNPVTGRTKYFYDIPQEVRKAIIKGDPEYLMYVQEEILVAVQEKSRGRGSLQIEFGKDLIFAMQRPMASLPGFQTLGWGLPNGTASLRDLSMKNVMRRAQSMVMHEHTIPFRVFSPQQTEAPSTILGSSSWKKEVETQYRRWLNDPSHIMTSPIPLNVQQVGGDRGALTLFPEIQVTNTDIIKGYGVPREFVEGGLTYSGSNVSIRMLENLLLDYVHRSERMVNWIISRVCEVTDLLPVEAKYQPFKMADDIQLKQLIFSMRQQKQVSHDLLGQYFDFNSKEQMELMAQEDVETALYQAKAQATLGVTVQKIQEAMMNTTPTPSTSIKAPISPDQVDQYAAQVAELSPDKQPKVMEELSEQQPDLARNISAKLDLSPSGGMNVIRSLMATPPAQQEQAYQDLQIHNPTGAIIAKLVMPNLGKLTSASSTQVVDMSAANTQRAPTGAKRSI